MSDNAEHPNSLRFVVFEEDGAWIAVCLEHYIGAQGSTLKEAREQLRIAYRADLDDSLRLTGSPFGGIQPAPDEIVQRYRNSPVEMRGSIYDKQGAEKYATKHADQQGASTTVLENLAA